MSDNHGMELLGQVQNGVVVMTPGSLLPEGAVVGIVYPLKLPTSSATQPNRPRAGKRVQLPLVESQHPGSVDLTNEQIHRILGQEELESLQRSQDVPS